jgi:predicted enzyme related to lactoylglutathione lyase
VSLIEFPADDTERAQRFWEGLLKEPLHDRAEREGTGCRTRSAVPTIGIHARERGPGDTASLPYFAVADMAAALERVRGLGGSVVHPGGAWMEAMFSEIGSAGTRGVQAPPVAAADVEAMIRVAEKYRHSIVGD